MKKFTLFFAFLLTVGFINAQVFVVENFSDGSMPPAGWSIDGYSAQWSNSASANAGGTAPEGKFTYTQAVDITRLIAPAADLTGMTSVTLSFVHYYDFYGAVAPTLGVATRSGGGDWTSVWEIFPSDDVGPESKTITITSDDVGATDFEFCFYLDGDFYNLDYWYVDNVELFNPFGVDCEMIAITTAPILAGPTPIEGVFKNKGINQITTVDVNWQVGDDDIYTTTFDGLALNFGDSYNFSCDDLFNYPVGPFLVDVWVSNVNGGPDDNPDNDLLMKNLNVASSSEQRVPCFEEFTSSTCAPCATFNTPFVPWCEDHAEDITLIKYQMNWPGSGDPYYTNEGGQRRTYYGVSGVPAAFGDGMYLGWQWSSGNVPAFYAASMVNPAFAAIASSHTLTGTQMDITTTVLPYAGIDNGLVQIIVFENVTTENTGTNGETEFHHVMMKMVPDAAGTSTDFVDRAPVTYQNSVDLSGTNVEEWDDLGVIVIVQDFISASVYQSGYSVEDADYSTDDELTSLNLDGELIPGFDPNKLDYYTQLDEGTTEPPEVTYTVSDESARTVLVDASELPGKTTVDVFAEDLATTKRYTVHFSIVLGVENRLADKVKLYPNPTTGLLNISGFESADVAVYSSTGALVGEYKDFNGTSIDISGMPNGIYFINIQTEEDVVTKRVTLYR